MCCNFFWGRNALVLLLIYSIWFHNRKLNIASVSRSSLGIALSEKPETRRRLPRCHCWWSQCQSCLRLFHTWVRFLAHAVLKIYECGLDSRWFLSLTDMTKISRYWSGDEIETHCIWAAPWLEINFCLWLIIDDYKDDIEVKTHCISAAPWLSLFSKDSSVSVPRPERVLTVLQVAILVVGIIDDPPPCNLCLRISMDGGWTKM